MLSSLQKILHGAWEGNYFFFNSRRNETIKGDDLWVEIQAWKIMKIS